MSTATLKRFWYATAVIMAAAACIVLYQRVQDISSTGKHFSGFPEKIGTWSKVEDIHYDEQMFQVLGTRDVLGRKYRDGTGRTLDVVVVHSINNRSAFHPPEYCLTGGGSEIIERKDSTFDSQGKHFSVNEMLFLRNSINNSRLLVWNWYAAGKDMDAGFYRQQRTLFINQLRSGRSPGSVINIYIPVTAENVPEARAAAEDFASHFVPSLEPYLE